MPGQGRLADKANVPVDAHGCPACPHPATGPAIVGSPDVHVNRRPALRVGDLGVHAACCAGNKWKAAAGSATVFINGKSAHRMGDQTEHCGGAGRLVEGSTNVMVGGTTSAGAAGAVQPAAAPGGAATRRAASPQAASPQAAGERAAGSQAAGSQAAGSQAATSQAAGSGAAAPATGPAAAASPAPPPAAPPDDPKAWIEIELIGEDGKGVVGERYVVVPPGGAPITGFLDEDGRAILDGLTPGTCQVSFPDLDSEAWQPAAP